MLVSPMAALLSRSKPQVKDKTNFGNGKYTYTPRGRYADEIRRELRLNDKKGRTY